MLEPVIIEVILSIFTIVLLVIKSVVWNEEHAVLQRLSRLLTLLIIPTMLIFILTIGLRIMAILEGAI